MSEVAEAVVVKLKNQYDVSEKGIIGIVLSLQNTLLKAALQIEHFVSHDKPTHSDVADAITAICTRIEEIDFPEDTIDDILCNIHKMVSVLEEKRNTT